MDFTEKMVELTGLKTGAGANIEEVRLAENELGVKFNKEYIKYLVSLRSAAAEGHEFTGLGKRLNVVDVTKEERLNNALVPSRYYVVEKLNIDGAIVWQSQSGRIYISVPNGEPERCNKSLYEYLSEDLD